ncbi:MAG: hypothetical protein JOY90_00485 [Bradyrhizobium sp.]|uniref:hypothetical protein n=1 Tax=Bradyrhizobium sp. TaxID=376 RepID=UPI001E174C65|nr:hypothetical protein [Bradyrhizobium sp.]MBV9558932.1 hypothetical protein [Bradyrhizobium sp.]
MNHELARRIVVTIGALLIFRLGSHVPVASIWTPAGPLPEGALVRVSIFSLGIVPYATAAVIIRLLSVVWGRLNRLERSGEAGRRMVLRCTLVTAVLIFALTFIYTSYVVDPGHAADRLAEQGGTIAGVASGEPTAGHLDRLVSLTTVVGAAYLTAVALLPEVLAARGAALPCEISGGSMLILVCTILDIRTQVRDVSLTNARGGRQ